MLEDGMEARVALCSSVPGMALDVIRYNAMLIACIHRADVGAAEE